MDNINLVTKKELEEVIKDNVKQLETKVGNVYSVVPFALLAIGITIITLALLAVSYLTIAIVAAPFYLLETALKTLYRKYTNK